MTGTIVGHNIPQQLRALAINVLVFAADEAVDDWFYVDVFLMQQVSHFNQQLYIFTKVQSIGGAPLPLFKTGLWKLPIPAAGFH